MPRRVSCIPSADLEFCDAATGALDGIAAGAAVDRIAAALADFLRPSYPLVEVHLQEPLAQAFVEDVWYAYRDGKPFGPAPTNHEAAPWIRGRTEGLLSQWHMPAGEGMGGLVLCACDTTFSPDAQLDKRLVGSIRLDERCPVCQGVHAVRVRNPG